MPMRDICFHMTTKKCSKCGVEKMEDCFHPDASKRSGFHSQCKECRNTFKLEKYYSDTDGRKRHIKRVNITKSSIRKDNQIKVMRIQKQLGCIDCDEHDPLVLDFDHVSGEKVLAISRMISEGMRWETIEAEIAKCEVRCANCHRRKTAREGNFYDGIDLEHLCYSDAMGTTEPT